MEPKPAPVTRDREDFYYPHTHNVVDQLGSLKGFEPDDVVWHYTSGSSFIEIVRQGTLFATQVSCLNDSTETRYASALLREALGEVVTAVKDKRTSNFLGRFLEDLSDTPDNPSHAPNPYFVSCFSQRKDDLSQWRGYANGENGLAIGMRVRTLFGQPNAVVVRVNYDADLHRTLALETAMASARYFFEGTSSQGDDWEEQFLVAWNQALSYLAPLIKHPAFAREEEVRIVAPFTVEDHGRVEIRQKKTLMSRHLPLRFPHDRTDADSRFPIYQVLVGPGRHKAITKISVNTLLFKHRYQVEKDTDVSIIPYQDA